MKGFRSWPGPLVFGLLVLALGLADGCTPASPVVTTALPVLQAMRAFSPLPPLPLDPTNAVADDERAARLGQKLFYDPLLSAGGRFSCASCHQPEHAFQDGKRTSQALGAGVRNTPGLALAGFQHWQGWAGRGDSIWSQALAALENPNEMGAHHVTIARRLLVVAASDYAPLFGPAPETTDWPATGGPGDAAYDVLRPEQRLAIARVAANAGQALEAYVRRLVPAPSAFDRYVAGDLDALTPQAVRGFTVFQSARCATCHAGPLFSDGEFHNQGLPQPIGEFDYGRSADQPKLLVDPFRGDGLFAASPVAVPTPGANDDGRFRTPTLRDVSRTAPYWHAGTFQSLEAVVDFDLAGGGDASGHNFPGTQDARLGAVSLSADERLALLAFLRSLDMGPTSPTWAGPLPNQGSPAL